MKAQTAGGLTFDVVRFRRAGQEWEKPFRPVGYEKFLCLCRQAVSAQPVLVKGAEEAFSF